MNAPTIAPIPTAYNGTEFRSRLEANAARLFDALEIPWCYEQESFRIDGAMYLPDFFLPEAKQFVELKGTADDPSLEKCRQLARGVRAPFGDDDEWARPAAVVVLSPPLLRVHLGAASELAGFGYNGQGRIDALLCSCPLCGSKFFATIEQSWECTGCTRRLSEKPMPVLIRATHKRGVTSYSEI